MNEEKKDKDKEKLKKFDPRGVQTLFRTLSRNHYNLLKMVDNKSRIMLTINSIIFSLLMGAMYIAPESEIQNIQFAAITLMRFCFVSMILALIGMLPHKYFGKKYKESSYRGILYSPNYTMLSLDEYRMEMKRVMENGNSVYDEMISDLYFLGKAITFKQRFLMVSFLVFLIGIIFTALYSLTFM